MTFVTWLWTDLPLFLGRVSIVATALIFIAVAIEEVQNARLQRRQPQARVLYLDRAAIDRLERRTRNQPDRHRRNAP